VKLVRPSPFQADRINPSLPGRLLLGIGVVVCLAYLPQTSDIAVHEVLVDPFELLSIVIAVALFILLFPF
jgi:hypothetical protein